MIKVILYFSLLSILSGCSTHLTKFDCGPSKGAFCKPLHEVDDMISSGEVEKLDLDLRKQKKCKICKYFNN